MHSMRHVISQGCFSTPVHVTSTGNGKFSPAKISRKHGGEERDTLTFWRGSARRFPAVAGNCMSKAQAYERSEMMPSLLS